MDECDVKGCKENLVIHGNFDNNMECCVGKEIGFLNMIPLVRSQRTK